ncbi:MAG: hypothetical protein E6K80_09320 [Candidatus Eisenbacteria bacterium]|uniref:Uncharacterized protein n=1 Tax=Eiseniibacteriota bacterium TaxID=2212470 RepID=A0A538U2X5_UNCEI|nr:MAG: hypothetical protein E6K80_09320 [Candidatus Eisenbacteria bacterium]
MSPALLEWSFNPWRDRPGRAATTVVAALACCTLAACLGLPGILTVILCVLCVSTLAAGFVPVRCRLDERGVVVHSAWVAERRAWDQLQRAVRGRDGVLLSPYRDRHWLEAYRAVFLPFPHGSSAPDDEALERILSSHGL